MFTRDSPDGREQQTGPAAVDKPVEEGGDAISELLLNAFTWLHATPGRPKILTLIGRAGRYAREIGRFDHRRQRLLCYPAERAFGDRAEPHFLIARRTWSVLTALIH